MSAIKEGVYYVYEKIKRKYTCHTIIYNDPSHENCFAIIEIHHFYTRCMQFLQAYIYTRGAVKQLI